MLNFAVKSDGVGDKLTANEFNNYIDELENSVTNSGQTLSGADTNQLGKAIAIYAGAGDYYLDSGSANAYVLSPVSLRQVPTSYIDGLKVRFVPDNTNTGASTVNLNGLGVKDIKRNGSTAIEKGMLTSGVEYLITYNSSLGCFILEDQYLKQDSITAYATGGQANAVALVMGTNIISVCATSLDSVKLPDVFNAGDIVQVTNKGAKTANVYPASGDTIDSASANTPIPLLPENTLIFFARTANSAWVLLSDGWQVSPEVDITITGKVTAWTADLQTAIFSYKNGVWYVEYNIAGLTTAASRTEYGITITGVDHFMPAQNKQMIGASTASATYVPTQGTVLNATDLQASHASVGNTAYYMWKGKVKLASKPTSYI